jgi:antitoxin component YwqK of YwqJK toxin-antitoxin module
MSDQVSLNLSDVWDDAQQIRGTFVARSESGWVPHGQYTAADEHGRIVLEITYDHGVVHGPYRDFWTNGKVASEGQFQEGQKEGIWHYYNPDGTFRELVEFKAGREVTGFP